MSRKRKAATAHVTEDAKLQRVERALENVKRTGVTFASGASERFPLPAIAFKRNCDENRQEADEEDDEHDELLLPLRKRDAANIKARGTISQQCEQKATAWDVDGALIESRNPKWHEFLDEWFTSKRSTLGIAPTAAVEITLNKLMLVEAGGRLDPVREGEVRGTGVFGRLLVVLPGAFDGGEFVVEQPVVCKYPSDYEIDDVKGEDDDAREDGEEQEEDERAGLEDEGEDAEREEDGSVDEVQENDGDRKAKREEGGEDDTRDEEDADSGDEAPRTTTEAWQPEARGNAYGISCAAFYDSCEFVSKCVWGGTALCLVYDLVTTTPSEVPLFAGSECVQQAVALAFASYFDASPAPMAKRMKIGSDAWRAIYEYIVQRRFVYPVHSSKFEYLYGDQRKIYDSLAAFCNQSGGQYVLYHATLLCSKSSEPEVNFRSPRDNSNADQNPSMTLTGSWIKDGISDTFNYPPLSLHHRYEVAQARKLEVVSYRHYIRDTAPANLLAHLSKMHGSWRDAKVFPTFALVMMPVSSELRLFPRLSLEDVIEKLRRLIGESRAEALQYAQRVVDYRVEWQVDSKDMNLFEEFVKLVVQLNDRRLFTDLLVVVRLNDPLKGKTFSSALQHFGWEACVDSLIKNIRNSANWRGRIHLILAVCHKHMRSEQLNVLLDALLLLYPWTDSVVGQPESRAAFPDIKGEEALTQLLAVTILLSPGRIHDLVSIPRARDLILYAVPALTNMKKTYLEQPVMRVALHRVWDLLEPVLPRIRNEPYAMVRIPEHCPTCQELQSFLTSEATVATVAVSREPEAMHVFEVLYRELRIHTSVNVTLENTVTLQLLKNPDECVGTFAEFACSQERRLRKALFQDVPSSSDESLT